MDADWLWRIGEKVLAVAGVIATAITSVLYKRYQDDRAMLYRHEQHIEATEGELGLCKSFRESCLRGPIGEPLMNALDELKGEDERLHARVSSTRKSVNAYSRQIAKLETDIKWIREALERMEKK